MDDYVSKPVRLESLGDALRRCVPLEPASPPAHDGGVLERAALEQLHAQAGDGAFVVELFDTFRRDGRALLETLRGALADADAAQLRRAAHTLKSNAALFGATGLAALCKELEGMAKAGTLVGAAELVARVDEEFARATEALQAAVQEVT
jgi:HPt (histidine-containing phosphotransfer) domain-containing protein